MRRPEVPSILIVDDQEINRDIARTVLESGGYRVFMASNGEEAMTSVLRDRPDAVLLDLTLPDMSGYEIAKRLHEELSDGVPRLAAYTGDSAKLAREMASEAGFDAFFLKPLGARELLNAVRDLLSGS